MVSVAELTEQSVSDAVQVDSPDGHKIDPRATLSDKPVVEKPIGLRTALPEGFSTFTPREGEESSVNVLLDKRHFGLDVEQAGSQKVIRLFGATIVVDTPSGDAQLLLGGLFHGESPRAIPLNDAAIRIIQPAGGLTVAEIVFPRDNILDEAVRTVRLSAAGSFERPVQPASPRNRQLASIARPNAIGSEDDTMIMAASRALTARREIRHAQRASGNLARRGH